MAPTETLRQVEHDQFLVEREPDGWVATCKGCGWRSGPVRHPLDVGDQTIPHSRGPA